MNTNAAFDPSRRRCVGWLAVAPLAVGGCAAPVVVPTATDATPAFDLRRYFNGPSLAQGLFIDRFGTVRRRFTVALQGRWSGQEGVLEEDFVYNDGERSRRVWTLKDLGQGRWEGRADDVIGVATGVAAGPSLRWRYRLRLPVAGRNWDVKVDDWMHLIDERHLLNRAVFSYWGVTIGEVQIAFQRPEQSS